MWRTAFDNPTIFAGFSIPPRSAPNPTNVHNWTFASISFAQSFGLETEINAAIATAAQNPSLANSIAVARAIRITAGDAETFDIDAINNENRDAFYAALGKRLVLLSSLPLDTRRKVTAALLGRCFQLGPSGLDAGIFAAALDAGLADPLTSHFAEAYRRRVDNNRNLRLCLIPMLQGIERLCET